MTAFPYGNVYLGLLMMYHLGRDNRVDCELTWSPDTIRWERVEPGRPLIPLGPARSYDAGCIYAQAGPPLLDGERIALYYGGSEAVHRGWKRHCLLCRATLRKDGFAGLEPLAADQPARLTTKPLRWTGGAVCVNADLHGGSMRVSLLDAAGAVLDESRPITEDATDLALRWTSGRAWTASRGTLLRLRFEWRGGRLYSFTGLELP
jgi:hypothetical protein